jgi:hypothetical protein
MELKQIYFIHILMSGFGILMKSLFNNRTALSQIEKISVENTKKIINAYR